MDVAGSCGPVPNAVHGDQFVIDHWFRRNGRSLRPSSSGSIRPARLLRSTARRPRPGGDLHRPVETRHGDGLRSRRLDWRRGVPPIPRPTPERCGRVRPPGRAVPGFVIGRTDRTADLVVRQGVPRPAAGRIGDRHGGQELLRVRVLRIAEHGSARGPISTISPRYITATRWLTRSTTAMSCEMNR